MWVFYEFHWLEVYEYLLNESPGVAARQPLGLVELISELFAVCQSQLRSEDVVFCLNFGLQLEEVH